MYFYYGSCGFVRKLKCSSLTFLIIDSHGASYADRGKKEKKIEKRKKISKRTVITDPQLCHILCINKYLHILRNVF